MADENIIIDVKVNTGEAGKSLKALRDEYKEQQKALNDLTVGSKEYIDQLSKLGNIKDEIGDLNTTIKAFSPEGKIQAFSTVVGGLASGFQAAQGAMGLFGKSGEDVQKMLLKVQSATAFAEGIKGVVGLKDGFRDLGAVLRANPIMLFATILVGIGTALFALKDKIGIVGDAFNAIGKVIGFVTDKIKQFTDWLGISDFAQQKLSQSIIDNSKRIQDANNQRYDSEIAAAQRAGKATELIEIEKLSAMTKTNDEVIKQLRLRQQAGQELSDEEKKDLQSRVDANRKAYVDIQNLLDKYNDDEKKKNEKANEEWKKIQEKKLEFAKQQADLAKKALDEQIANDKKEAESAEDLINRRNELYQSDLKNKLDADLAKLESDWLATNRSTEAHQAYLDLKSKLESDYNASIEASRNKATQKQKDRLDENAVVVAELNAITHKDSLDAQIAFLEAQRQVELDNENLTVEQKALINERYRQSEEELTKKSAEAKRDSELQIASQITQGLQGLSDLYFTVKKSNLKKGSAEEKKAAKEQFEINKKLSLVSATITGIQSVISAYNAGSQTGAAGVVLGPLMAVIAGIAAATNIAKISASTFEGGASSPASDSGASGASAAATGIAINSPTSSSTLLNADGTIKNTQSTTPEAQKVVVVESDITSKQGRVAMLQENSKY